MVRCVVIVRWIVVIVRRPMLGVGRYPRFVTIWFVKCVGCDPDCVDRTVPKGGDDYPVGTLSSEPLCYYG